MKTIKRSIPEIDTNLKNLSKYFNQMTWKGLMHNQNIFAVDQLSLQEAKNVYVDTEGSLISRYPLQQDTTLPSGVLPVGYSLIEIKPIAEENVYVSKSPEGTYFVTIDGTPPTSIEGFASYHLSTIDHYVICFNEVDAKVFDTNYPEKGWQKLTDLAEVPITKRIVGGQETEYPKNGFTKSFKEQYIWSNESQPQLPTSPYNKPVRLTPDRVDLSSTAMLPAYEDCEVIRTSTEVITGIRIGGNVYTKAVPNQIIEGKYSYNNTDYYLQAENKYSVKSQWNDWTFGTYLFKPGTFTEGGLTGDVPTGEVVLNAGKRSIDWTIPQTAILTDYRILRPLNIKVEETDLFSVAMGIICIGREDYFLVSYDEGNTFDKVWYPNHDLFLKVASISSDGQYFFFVAKDAVYRCNLADKSWSRITVLGEFGGDREDLGTDPGANNTCHFLTGDVFAFLLYNETTQRGRLYWKGPGLALVNISFQNLMGYSTIPRGTDDDPIINMGNNRDRTSKDCDRVRIVCQVNEAGDNTTIMAIFPSTNAGKQRIMTVKGTSDRAGNAPTATNSYYEEDGNYGAVSSSYLVNQRYTDGDRSAYGLGVLGVIYLPSHVVGGVDQGAGWYNFRIETGTIKLSDGSFQGFYDFTVEHKLPVTSSAGYPYKLTGGWIDNLTVYDTDAVISATLPTEITERQTIWTMGDYFYIQVGSEIYTNRLSNDDTATITYTYTADEDDNKYMNVPNVSYSDTELYLGFGNLIQITANIRNGTEIAFNLPPINDHTFISNITGMQNISTTEVALFFQNAIVICSKVEDSLLGYRYDYYNTKLSTGTRLGDSIINTLEGAYTVFPTRRGLAFMNYQAFMATTDQVIEYVTDHIKNIWTTFYDASSAIKIMQWRNKLVLTNGTRELLIFDLDESSWWQWEVPINIVMTLTDQIDLKLISDTLYVFKESNVYMDFPKTPRETMIDWKVQSQPLHMNAPNYYKNMKQLVFQLLEGAESDTQHTLMAQIKLYRKRVTVRDPEVVAFKIEELRTFVKRFNYWKINEVQWGLGADLETATPTQLRLNGISVKYELGEEVR